HPVRHHLHRAGHRPHNVDAHQCADRRVIVPQVSTPLYNSRQRRNKITMGLAFAATAFGLSWLVIILAVLLWKGFSGLSLAVFTEMTPPPGAAGGLLNPIIGSLMLTVLAVLIGPPIGI